MGADVLDVERAADHRFQRLVGGIALRDVELGVAQVTNARGEAEAQQVHQREDVVREPCRVGVSAPRSAGRIRDTAGRRARRSSRARRRSRPWWNGAYWSEIWV